MPELTLAFVGDSTFDFDQAVWGGVAQRLSSRAELFLWRVNGETTEALVRRVRKRRTPLPESGCDHVIVCTGKNDFAAGLTAATCHNIMTAVHRLRASHPDSHIHVLPPACVLRSDYRRTALELEHLLRAAVAGQGDARISLLPSRMDYRADEWADTLHLTPDAHAHMLHALLHETLGSLEALEAEESAAAEADDDVMLVPSAANSLSTEGWELPPSEPEIPPTEPPSPCQRHDSAAAPPLRRSRRRIRPPPAKDVLPSASAATRPTAGHAAGRSQPRARAATTSRAAAAATSQAAATVTSWAAGGAAGKRKRGLSEPPGAEDGAAAVRYGDGEGEAYDGMGDSLEMEDAAHFEQWTRRVLGESGERASEAMRRAFASHGPAGLVKLLVPLYRAEHKCCIQARAVMERLRHQRL